MLKLLFDRFFSLLILLSFFWLYILIGLIVLINLGFPIFYIAERVGKNNKVFKIFKFRTMEHNSNNPKNSIMNFLRKTNLDELPQFFNVVIGDMSVVGPRPHDLEEDKFFAENIPNYKKRRIVKPGVTGLSAIMGNRGGNDLEKIKERTIFDLEYIRKKSFSFDLYIIAKTILTIFRPNH